MDKIVETYNPYNQNVERKSSQLPGYITETFINSVEVRSPFIAGNKGYIGGTLQVGQDGIKIDGNAKTIKSNNYIDGTAGWIINSDGNAQFNNIVARGTFILSGGETVEEAINDIDVSWGGLSNKPSVLSLAAISNPTPVGSGLFISNTHMGYYSSGQWKTYMQSNGNFGLSGSGSNSLTWNGSTLNITGNISASSISGGTVDGATITSTYNDGATYYNTTVVGGQLTQNYYNVSTSARRARLITQAGGMILQASTNSGSSYSDTVFISSVVGSSIRYGQIALYYNGGLSGNIEATSSGLSIIGSINNSGNITTDSIYTDSTSYMYDIIPYNSSSWLGRSGNPWSAVYTNDLIAPNATINIYGFKINTSNYFSGAPGGNPVGRIQFQLSNGNVYVLPVYNP